MEHQRGLDVTEASHAWNVHVSVRLREAPCGIVRAAKEPALEAGTQATSGVQVPYPAPQCRGGRARPIASALKADSSDEGDGGSNPSPCAILTAPVPDPCAHADVSEWSKETGSNPVLSDIRRRFESCRPYHTPPSPSLAGRMHRKHHDAGSNPAGGSMPS